MSDTIASVAAQCLPPGIALRLVVADNEPEPASRAVVEGAAAAHGVPLVYVHAPAANISIARNACLDAARSDWIAFIDDDECAEPDWVEKLIAHRNRAEIVFGVSRAVYEPGTARWIVAGDFHSNRLGPRDGAHNGYTCNVLMDRRFVEEHRLRFDLSLGRTGGEDTLFFDRASAAGARFAYAPDAVVSEPIPGHRATLGWLGRRRYRSGQVDYLLRKRAGRDVRRRGAMAVGKVGYCLLRAAVAAPRREEAARHLLRGLLHVGFLASLMGRGVYEEYR